MHWGDRKEYELNSGEVWYYPSGSYQNYRPKTNDFHYAFLTIDGQKAEYLFSGLAIQPGINYAGNCPIHLFSQLRMTIEKQLLSSEFSSLVIAFQILTMISEGRHLKASRGGMAEQAKNIIDASFSLADTNVSEVAAFIGVHPGSLSRVFSAEYGIPATKYLSLCRLNYAKKLLSDTNTAIKKIASLSGFHSHEYFTHVFRKYTGMNPMEFRSQARLGDQKNKIDPGNK